MANQLDGAKLNDLGEGERVEVNVAGVPVTVLRAFELTTQRRTQRRRFEFRTTDVGELTVTAFDATPALTVSELLELDWSALSLRAFALASAPAAMDRRRAAVERRDASLEATVERDESIERLEALRSRLEETATNRPGRKAAVARTPEMLQRVLELHGEHGIEAVRREFQVSTRTAYNYLTEAQEAHERAVWFDEFGATLPPTDMTIGEEADR